MIWEDILITRDVSERDISAALTTVFGIHQDRVLVIADLGAHAGIVTDDIGVLCERRTVAGDFVLHRRRRYQPVHRPAYSRTSEYPTCQALLAGGG